MSPDTLESRMAALKQHVEDLADDIHSLAGATAAQAVFTEQMNTVRENLRDIRKDMDGLHVAFRNFKDGQTEREAAIVKERKADRRWLIGTVLASTGVIIAALTVVASAFG